MISLITSSTRDPRCFIYPKFVTDYSLIRSLLYWYVETSRTSGMTSLYMSILKTQISKTCKQLFLLWQLIIIFTDDAILSLYLSTNKFSINKQYIKCITYT
jgi:hypothetical protein